MAIMQQLHYSPSLLNFFALHIPSIHIFCFHLHHHFSSLNPRLSLDPFMSPLQFQGFPTLLQQQQPLLQQQHFVEPTSGAGAGLSTAQCGLLCHSLPSLPTLGEKDM